VSGDAARVSVWVAVAPADAFEVFTREIDRWWRTGPKYRVAGKRRGQLHLEERLGGRVFETFDADVAKRSQTVQVGVITAWNPPERVAFEWRNANFVRGELTYVDVTFTASGDGTMVTVHHHGWSAIPDDHPARHGLSGAAFARQLGMWWASLLTGLREHVAK
jgi:uncharacterized protein YndB with AHSA1/START domain